MPETLPPVGTRKAGPTSPKLLQVEGVELRRLRIGCARHWHGPPMGAAGSIASSRCREVCQQPARVMGRNNMGSSRKCVMVGTFLARALSR